MVMYQLLDKKAHCRAGGSLFTVKKQDRNLLIFDGQRLTIFSPFAQKKTRPE